MNEKIYKKKKIEKNGKFLKSNAKSARLKLPKVSTHVILIYALILKKYATLIATRPVQSCWRLPMNDHFCAALVATVQVIEEQEQPSTNSVEEFGHFVNPNPNPTLLKKKPEYLLSQR